ncbi:MAG: carboxypeptidase regulatory-like domain-containing protein [Lachnospiraceae bacterium]|nr:carboxypeptidase regulatory-like domain-containing protein [Lachnospiraceae bacterium]
MSKIINAETPAYSGNLTINVTSTQGLVPIDNAKIEISYTREPDTVVTTLTTDDSGQTDTVSLPAPNINYSTEPSEVKPYSEYNISITAPGYESVFISGTEILPDVTAVQPVSMTPIELEEPDAPPEEDIIIPDHTLYGEYPPKIPEDEIKPMNESGEIVLSRVVIPEYIVVHDGVPQDSSAPNYYVRYTDYIKNVVSSEIYATWPENTIYANTLVIMSFTLNRVYTEWYLSQQFRVFFPPHQNAP